MAEASKTVVYRLGGSPGSTPRDALILPNIPGRRDLGRVEVGPDRRSMSRLGIVVSIVLIDLLGFTLVMPLLPPFARQYGFTPLQIGWLLAAYPMCQLVAAPILGRLSDRYGRRPVLIASQAATALSFLV